MKEGKANQPFSDYPVCMGKASHEHVGPLDARACLRDASLLQSLKQEPEL